PAGSGDHGTPWKTVIRKVVLLVLALGTLSDGLAATRLDLPIEPRVGPPTHARDTATQPKAKRFQPGRVDLYGVSLPDGAVARMGTNRFNHAHGVAGLAFAPDGKSLVSYSFASGTARIWDPSTGRERQGIEVEELQGGRNFTLSPDGTSLLGAERDYS